MTSMGRVLKKARPIDLSGAILTNRFFTSNYLSDFTSIPFSANRILEKRIYFRTSAASDFATKNAELFSWPRHIFYTKCPTKIRHPRHRIRRTKKSNYFMTKAPFFTLNIMCEIAPIFYIAMTSNHDATTRLDAVKTGHAATIKPHAASHLVFQGQKIAIFKLDMNSKKCFFVNFKPQTGIIGCKNNRIFGLVRLYS